LHYTRELERNGRDIKDERREFITGRSQAPYVSLRPEVIASRSFVHPLPDGRATYYAPDTDVLLSDAFVDTHCMRVVEGPDGTVGLLVKPIEGRGLSDIEGTMRLDAATARLQSIEYSYVNLPARIRNPGDIGGEVVFSGLPNGTWIVREWRVRTPLMAFIGGGVQMRRIGYHDEGGVVWRAIDRTDTAVLEAGTGTVTGTLVDSAGQPPSGGVLVRTGLGDEARSSANDGSVVLGGWPAAFGGSPCPTLPSIPWASGPRSSR